MKTVIEKQNGFWTWGVKYENQTFYMNFKSKRKSEVQWYAKQFDKMIIRFKFDVIKENVDAIINGIK